MAKFRDAFQQMIKNEGGYVLHTVEGDRGGMTYAGIARKFHPGWSGWVSIDDGTYKDVPLFGAVASFYKDKFWSPLKGDLIKNNEIAYSIFDFAVNAGTRTSIRLAQLAVGVRPDGVIGPDTLGKLNQEPPAKFLCMFALAKIGRYAEICRRNPSQKKFLLGWVNRTLKGLL